MIITYRTGSEPNHKVAISVRHIACLTPNGGFTYIHLVNGEKYLVDGSFDGHRDKLEVIMELMEKGHE